MSFLVYQFHLWCVCTIKLISGRSVYKHYVYHFNNMKNPFVMVYTHIYDTITLFKNKGLSYAYYM